MKGKEKEKVGRMNPDHRGSTQAGDERHFPSLRISFWKTLERQLRMAKVKRFLWALNFTKS